MRALLCDREGRLGHTSTEEIKAHPFFKGVDWSALRRDGAAPFRPHISSQVDTSHFDQFEERAWPSRTGGDVPQRKEEDLVFSDYTFKRFNRNHSDAILQAVGPPTSPSSTTPPKTPASMTPASSGRLSEGTASSGGCASGCASEGAASVVNLD